MRNTFFVGWIACASCSVPFVIKANELVPFEAFYPLAGKGISYQVPAPVAKAVTTLHEWEALWREIEMRSTVRDEENAKSREPPRINFAQYTLLLVATGSRPSGGYSVGFQSVREYESHIDVSVFELRPFGKECIVTTVVTYPAAFALIPRTNKSIRFQMELADLTCGQ